MQGEARRAAHLPGRLTPPGAPAFADAGTHGTLAFRSAIYSAPRKWDQASHTKSPRFPEAKTIERPPDI